MHLAYAPGVEMPRQIEAERATVPSTTVRGHKVCRMHGAAGGAPRGNTHALKHGAHSAEIRGSFNKGQSTMKSFTLRLLGWKESSMTEIDDPLVEAEINELNAALMREIVAIGTIICLLLIWVGLHY